MEPSRIARPALVAVDVGAALAAAGLKRAEDGCTDAVKEMLFATDQQASGRPVDATVAAIESDCDGGTRLVDSAGILLERGHRGHAVRLLREAAHREPENFAAWAALARVLERSDPDEAREAAARARALNSLYRPPA